MYLTDTHESEEWRVLDRHVQNISDPAQVRAQAILDLAEDTRRLARSNGSEPLDELLSLYDRAQGIDAKRLIGDAMLYLRAESHLRRPARRISLKADLRQAA